MPEGGCFCGNIRIEADTSNAKAKIICNCTDCRKISGSLFSTNLLIPQSSIKLLQGKPKQYDATADSGGKLQSNFCGDCGTTVWRTGTNFGDNAILKAGVMDGTEVLDSAHPQQELYMKNAVSWMPKIEGTERKDTM